MKRTWVGLSLAACLLTAGSVAAQEGTLFLVADAPCTVTVDDQEYRLPRPKMGKVVPVGLGEHYVRAQSLLDGAVWEKVVSVEDEGQVVVQIEFDVDLAQALMSALDREDTEQAQLLIAAGADVDVTDPAGRSPLMLAVKNGQGEVVETLLDSGADVDRATGSGWTALLYAVRDGAADLVHLLIEAGANLSARSVEAGLSGDTGWGVLHWAAFEEALDTLKLLIVQGAHVDSQSDRVGYTPLHVAAGQCWEKGVEALLAARADINERTATRATPLWMAKQAYCPKSVIRTLKKAGAGM